MAELNIDATNLIVGRVAAFAAKQALLGYSVKIFNCEKAVMSGNKQMLHQKYYRLIAETGQPTKGPHLSKMPDRFVRRIVRGMLDYKNPRGSAAFKRIMCYIGVPAQFKDLKLEKVTKEAKELPVWKYSTIGDICVSLGGKV